MTLSIYRIFFFLVLFSILGNAFAEDMEANEFDNFFRAFKEKRDGVGSLTAHFTQQTILPDEIITTEGTLYYSKPRRILFKTDAPNQSILIDGRRGYEYDSEIRQLTVFDIEDHPRADIFFLGFDDNTESLQRAYQLELMITHDTRGMQGINIKPRTDTDDAVYFTEVNLFLREKDFLPYRIHIVNDEESELFIDIDQIVPQASPDLDAARILVAPGVKIIENDTVVDTVEEERYFPPANPSPEITAQELSTKTGDDDNPTAEISEH